MKAAWAPGDLGYNTRVPNDMLIATVVLCYSVIAPLIIPFGVAYFALGWLIAKNQVSQMSFSFTGVQHFGVALFGTQFVKIVFFYAILGSYSFH